MKQKQDKRSIDPNALQRLRRTLLQHFSRQQFHQVNIRAICEEAKVSPKTIYKYFGNKDQMLSACIEQDLAQLSEHCQAAIVSEQSALDNIINFLQVWFDYFEQHIELARIIFLIIPVSYWLSDDMQDRRLVNAVLSQLIVAGQQQDAITTEVGADTPEHMVIGGLRRNLVRWLIGDQPKLHIIKQETTAVITKILSP